MKIKKFMQRILLNVYCRQNINRIINSGENEIRICRIHDFMGGDGKSEGKRPHHLKDVAVNDRILLKYLLKFRLKMWN